MICFEDFYLVKNHKIAKSTAPAESRENPLNFKNFFDVCLTESENNKILLYKFDTDFYRQQVIYWMKGPHSR